TLQEGNMARLQEGRARLQQGRSVFLSCPPAILPFCNVVIALVLGAGLLTSAQSPRGVSLGDWPEARGPSRDGVSKETGLPDKWALDGQNFLWRVPYGGRSAPIVMGNRVYVQNPSGRGPELQE